MAVNDPFLNTPGLGGQLSSLTVREPELSGLRQQIHVPLIFHVDDDPSIRKFTGLLLVHNGYRIRSFGDGDSALEALQRTTPDLLITDVMHPGLYGFDLIRAAADLVQERRPRLMLVTAFMPGSWNDPHFEDIDVMWLIKPIRTWDLLNSVQHLIGKGAPRPIGAPTLSETLYNLNWEAEEIVPPFLVRS